MVIGKGSAQHTLSEEEVHEFVAVAAKELNVRGKCVLVVIPDGTRTMPMALMFELLQEEIGKSAAVCDYLVALGTHQGMSDAQLSRHLGQPVENGKCGGARIFNHRWDLNDTFIEIGTISADEVAKVSGKLLHEAITVKLNRLICEYDQVLLCGPVFPHEVVGFSGGNKYLFPGISGKAMIDQTHWLGALLGSYHIIGTQNTPVRELIDRAAAAIKVPVACMALVMCHAGISGFYFGGARESWKAAADLSAQVHIEWVEKPFRRALAIMPQMYVDIWTAAKGMYKAEPAMMDEGEVVIYAPHITEFSYTHGPQIESIGYHCRDYFLKQWKHFADVPRGILAHSTHLRGQGAFDSTTGFERDRIRVTLATGISEQRCHRANLGYLDPSGVRPEEWLGRENEGVKLMPNAGERLYRLRKTLRPG